MAQTLLPNPAIRWSGRQSVAWCAHSQPSSRARILGGPLGKHLHARPWQHRAESRHRATGVAQPHLTPHCGDAFRSCISAGPLESPTN